MCGIKVRVKDRVWPGQTCSAVGGGGADRTIEQLLGWVGIEGTCQHRATPQRIVTVF